MRRVFLLAAGTFALGLDAYVLAGLLPGIGSSMHVSLAAAGQVVTGFTLSYALGSPVLAAVSAGIGRRLVLAGSLAVFAAANIASALAPALWVLIVARVAAGAAAGLYAPSAAAAATGLVSAAQRGRALSVVLGGLTLATVAGVPAGLLLGVHAGWRATLLLVAALAIAAGASIAVLLPKVSAPPPPGLRQRLAVLGDRWVLGRVSVMLLLGVANLGLYTYLAAVLRDTAGITPAVLPPYLLAWGAAGAAGNAFIGWLLDRGRRPGRLLAAIITVLAAALAVIPVAAVSAPGAALVLLAWGGAAWSLQVPLQYQLTTTVPEHAASAVGLLASAVYLGSAIGAGLGGLALTAVTPRFLPLPAAAIAVLALLVSAATAARGRSRPQPPARIPGHEACTCRAH